jgi:hypothetical protein
VSGDSTQHCNTRSIVARLPAVLCLPACLAAWRAQQAGPRHAS